MVLERFGISDCKGVVTPLEPNVKYSKQQEATTEEEVKTMEVIDDFGTRLQCLNH